VNSGVIHVSYADHSSQTRTLLVKNLVRQPIHPPRLVLKVLKPAVTSPRTTTVVAAATTVGGAEAVVAAATATTTRTLKIRLPMEASAPSGRSISVLTTITDASSPVPLGDDAHEGQADEQNSSYRGRGRGRGHYRGRGRGYYSNNYHYDQAAPAQVEGEGDAGAAPLTPADEAGGDGDGRGRGRGYHRGRGRGRGYYKNYAPREDGAAEAGAVDAPGACLHACMRAPG
jgi:hypothetical protein